MRTEAVLSLALLLQAGSVGCGGAPPTSAPPTVAAPAPAVRAIAPPAPPRAAPLRAPVAQPAPSLLPPPLQRYLPGGVPRGTPHGSEPIVLARDATSGLPAWLRVADLPYEKKSDYWSPCVREFVQTQPEAARLELGEALSRYSTSCTTGPGRRVEFRTPRAGPGPAQSYLGLVGALERTRCEVSLTAAYVGEPVHAERITLIADRERWSSARIAFDRDDGWEIATLPLTRSLLRVVQQAIAAQDTVLRFEGAHGYEDVVVGDDMKQDLRAMLDALDAIGRP